MRPKQQRLWLLVAALAVIGVAIYLILSSFKEHIVFFYSPTDLLHSPPADGTFVRVGGFVEEGSLEHLDGGMVQFRITDFEEVIVVEYRGSLPDLFREGQGVVAEGYLKAEDIFGAERILAKHDEKYLPPEVAKALKKQGHWKQPYTQAE